MKPQWPSKKRRSLWKRLGRGQVARPVSSPWWTVFSISCSRRSEARLRSVTGRTAGYSRNTQMCLCVERPSWFWCRHERWQRWRQSACDCSSLSPGSVGPVWENLVQRDWSKVSGTGWSLGCCFRDYEFRIFFFLKRGVGGMYNLITVSMRWRGLF